MECLKQKSYKKIPEGNIKRLQTKAIMSLETCDVVVHEQSQDSQLPAVCGLMDWTLEGIYVAFALGN